MCSVSMFVRGNMVILDDYTEKKKRDCGFVWQNLFSESASRGQATSWKKISSYMVTILNTEVASFDHLNWTCDGAFEPIFH